VIRAMKRFEWTSKRKWIPRLLIVLVVLTLYLIDLRIYTAKIVAKLTGASLEGRTLVTNGGTILQVEWESSGLVAIAVLSFLFFVTGDIVEYALSTFIYFVLNVFLLLIVVYAPEAYVVFWFYSAFSIVIAYILGYYLVARMKYGKGGEKPMPPPPAEILKTI